MNLENEQYQIMEGFKHIYFFDYTWENFRKVNVYSRNDLTGKEFDLSELEGIIFSSKRIDEKQFPITDLKDVLEKYDARLLYFENFERS